MKTGGEWALLSPGGTYHKLSEPNFFVGREDNMDLTLKSRSVDKKHAVITVRTENNLYKLHDLGTLNGTFVNEIRVKQQPVDLQLRDNIRFGYDQASNATRHFSQITWLNMRPLVRTWSETAVCDPRFANDVKPSQLEISLAYEKMRSLCLPGGLGHDLLSCEEKILYGPKWISIEETNTVCDMLRCATGEKYLSRRLKVVVASEKSLRDFSFVKLGLPVVVLERNDKKIVSFLLKPEDPTVNTQHISSGSLPSKKYKIFIGHSQQNLLERQLLSENGRSPDETWMKSHNKAATERNSDEDLPHPGTAEQGVFMYHGMHSPHLHQSQYHHYPYPYVPMYHHPPVVCHCSLCTGQYRPVHSTHSPAPGGFSHYQQASNANWTHGTAALQARPRLQRPMSVPGDKIEMMVKGSPLYGQPPWWGWGSSDDEVYSYPNTATILDSENHALPQQALDVRRKKPLAKRDTIEMAQRRNITGSVSVLSESKAQIVTTSQMTYDSGPERALKQRQECIVFQKETGVPRPSYGDQLSPVFENSTTMDWESPSSYKERIEQDATLRNFDSSADTSPDDASDEHWRYSYEIPFIPDYDEVPERPVSQKRDRGKGTNRDSLGESTLEDKQDRLSRKKSCGKIKKKTVPLDISGKDGRAATAVRRLSSDTSESDCEPSKQSLRRSGLAAMTPSNSRVFGLTELNLQRGTDGERVETLSRTHPLPSWVQQWSNSSNSHDSLPAQPIEVVGSSSAAEDSAASSAMSTTSHALMNQGSETDNKSKAVTRAPSPSQGRPRSAVSRGQVASVARSQSLSSSSKILSSRVTRSKTISAAVRRSYPTPGSGADDVKKTEIPRRRGTVSSASEDSDVESSDTSQKMQTKDAPGKSDGGDKRGVQLVPEKEGKRPFSAPRPNKTAMLRAHNSREAVKNSGMKNRSPSAAKGKATKNSFVIASTSADNACVSPPSARVWTPSAKRSGQSSTSNDNQETGDTGAKVAESSNGSPVDGSATQHAVDEIFESGPARVLPESFQMKRDDAVNKTFVLDEGKGDTSVSSLEEDSMVVWVDAVSKSRNVSESKNSDETSLPGPSPSRPQPPKLDLEATSSEGISLRSKLIPFAPFFKSQPYTPPLPDQPFEPPTESPDDASGGSRSSTVEGRPASPESVTSVPPALSPSPPLTPGAVVRSLLDFEGGVAGSPSRRQWGVTDKPVEDLMLSSIHAFSLELRLASESVLAKVKSLYEGSEELNGSSKSRTNSDNKQDSESVIPDWKSSHAEIAGIFRNLRKVELRLRTMEQALSIMCVAAKKEPTQTFTERKLSMMDTSSSGSFQNWREFKIKARRNSWAMEHRNQFPVPPESEEDDVDTA